MPMGRLDECMMEYKDENQKRTYSQKVYWPHLLAVPIIFLAFYLAIDRHTTPFNALSNDMRRYNEVYNASYFYTVRDYIESYRFEPGFTSMFKFLNSAGFDFLQFLYINQIVYFGSLFIFLRSIAPKMILLTSVIFVLSVYVPTNFLISNNALRQAWAMSFLFLALALLIKSSRIGGNRKFVFIAVSTLFIIGITFHYSLILIFLLIFIATRVSVSVAACIWIVLATLYSVNFPGLQTVLENYLYPLIENRSTGAEAALESSYELGFKVNYLLLSVTPLIAWMMFSITRLKISRPLSLLFTIYFVINCFCFLLSYLPFNDRFFHYSWSIIPPLMLGVIYEYYNSRLVMNYK